MVENLKIMIRLAGMFLFLTMLFVLSSKPCRADETLYNLEQIDINTSMVEAQEWFQIPFIGSIGFEFITEGTNNYPLQRKLRSFIPFDFDITFLWCLGFTGNKVYIKFTDDGDMGDRIFAIALAYYNDYSVPFWGTLYSTTSHSSFELSIPSFSPGVFIAVLSGFFAPTPDQTEPYSYTISVSFPQ